MHGLNSALIARSDLIVGNILSDTTAAPGLQAQQRELQKHMRANSLEKQLQQRPDPDELVREGILNGKACWMVCNASANDSQLMRTHSRMPDLLRIAFLNTA